jgi:serine/threonine protein phosphatase PrpC/CRP-like cAMP-binding protein
MTPQEAPPGAATANGGRAGQAAKRPSVATPYNRAKDRVDAIKESRTIECDGVKMTYAYLSQRGFYPDDPFKPNQDSYCIHEGLVKDKQDALFGVFDGHGKDGDGCAIFAKNQLPADLKSHVEKSKKPGKELTRDQMQRAILRAHVETNRRLRQDPNVDDSLSGTTAISVYFHGRRNRITIANVGDSRAVLGQAESSGAPESTRSLKALPLSRDQTPYRKDERARIRATGARVLSLDQLEGLEPIYEEGMSEQDCDFELGEELDEGGDPPRVWHPDGDYPGTAFTRSIGDAMAEELGVFAEPEMLTREILPEDKIIVLASDGVYEFLTNQSVIDIAAKFADPLEACRAVVAEAYELWLQYEMRTDDITIICIFIDGVRRDSIEAEEPSTRDEDDLMDIIDNAALTTEGLRPVRKNVSKEKSKEIERLKAQGKNMEAEYTDEHVDLNELKTEKTPEERSAIEDAVKASVMFRNVSDEQRELVIGCMESIPVKAGTWVIKQGTVGDRFYIVDEGRFEVRIVPDGEVDVTGQGGHIVHCYEGSREKHAHPSFGELALMHSAPRSASIVAQTDGHLFALHRAAFRQILLQAQDHRKDLKRVLGEIPYFQYLDSDGINKLAAIMEDITFGRGEKITTQGDVGTHMYVLESGSCSATQDLPGETKRTNLKAGAYFGDEIFSGDGKYSHSTVALQTTTCWMLDAALLKQTMGPLLQGN